MKLRDFPLTLTEVRNATSQGAEVIEGTDGVQTIVGLSWVENNTWTGAVAVFDNDGNGRTYGPIPIKGAPTFRTPLDLSPQYSAEQRANIQLRLHNMIAAVLGT